MTQKEIDKLRLIQVLHQGIPWGVLTQYFCRNCSGYGYCKKNNPTVERIYFLVKNFPFRIKAERLTISIGKCFKKKKGE
jgi:hypothetical protein